MRTLILIAAAAAAIALPAQAQYLRAPGPDIVDNSLDAPAPRATTMPYGMPQRNIGGGYEIVSGGVTGEERAAMDVEQRGRGVKLVFAATNGEYLSDVMLTVRNAKGVEVARLDRTEGPYVFIALPPGSYTVTATLDRETHTQKIAAGKGRRSYTIRFRPQ